MWNRKQVEGRLSGEQISAILCYCCPKCEYGAFFVTCFLLFIFSIDTEIVRLTIFLGCNGKLIREQYCRTIIVVGNCFCLRFYNASTAHNSKKEAELKCLIWVSFFFSIIFIENKKTRRVTIFLRCQMKTWTISQKDR